MINSIRSIISVLVIIAAGSASALTITDISNLATPSFLSLENGSNNLNYHEGDTASYKMDIGNDLHGTMSMTVKSVTDNAVIINQITDFMGKNQQCDVTVNPQTGVKTKVSCNGQAQEPGNSADIEVVLTKEDHITVPAGSFDCVYMKTHNKKDNSDVDLWVNSKLVPIMGTIKISSPTKIGEFSVELVSFKKY